MHLYVYYQASSAASDDVRRRVREMQAELGLPHARLLRRVRVPGQGDTWMEVYEHVPDTFESRLDEAAVRHGLAASTGPRHVERFEDPDACA